MLVAILLEAILTLFILAVVITQLVLPAIFGMPLFPIFRKSMNAAQATLDEEKELLAAAKLEEEAAELHAQAVATKNKVVSIRKKADTVPAPAPVTDNVVSIKKPRKPRAPKVVSPTPTTTQES